MDTSIKARLLVYVFVTQRDYFLIYGTHTVTVPHLWLYVQYTCTGTGTI
jgi:hypothetical protein